MGGWKIHFLTFAVLAPKLSKASCSGNTIVMNTLLNMEESIEISVKTFTCCKQARNQMALPKQFSAILNNIIFHESGTSLNLFSFRSHAKEVNYSNFNRQM